MWVSRVLLIVEDLLYRQRAPIIAEKDITPVTLRTT